jgi:hypothetical protein
MPKAPRLQCWRGNLPLTIGPESLESPPGRPETFSKWGNAIGFTSGSAAKIGQSVVRFSPIAWSLFATIAEAEE